MVHEIYDPTTSISLAAQDQFGGGDIFAGRLFQRGRGLGYYGRHRGAGIGHIFGHVWRYLRPYAVSAAKAVGKQGAETGARILSNLAQGADLKETALTEGKEGVKTLLEKAATKLQRGKGLGILKRRRRRQLLQPKDFIGQKVSGIRAIKKRQRQDTFGFY